MFITRRDFFQLASAALSMMLVNPLNYFRSLVAPEGELRPIKPPRPNPFMREGKSLVAVVRGKNIDQMVRESVNLIGGVEKLKIRGKRVLVKPNVVAADPPPTTTHPEVVRSVVRLFYEAGASKVIVGDMSALARLPTDKNLEQTGIKKAAEEAGAEVIDFDAAEWIEVKPPQARLIRSIHIARPVYEADVLINLPVVKTHQNAVYSICLKNLVGVTHPRYRPYRVNPAKWEEVVAEINLAAHPDLNIVDGTTSMVAGGPWKGVEEKTHMMIASGDRIAADVVGLGLIKSFDRWQGVAHISVWDQRQIRYAQELGLGIKDGKSLQIITKLQEGDEAEFSKLMARIREFVEQGVS